MTKEEAQQRNWLKGRLMGLLGMLSPGRAPTTEMEKQMFKEMREIRDDLIDQWDDSTEAINGKPLPEYKCYWCGKRGHKKYEVQYKAEIIVVCRKHYNEAVTQFNEDAAERARQSQIHYNASDLVQFNALPREPEGE